MTQLSPAIDAIRSAGHIAVVSHISPDPDAVGSTLGLGLALREMNKQVVMLNADVIQASLRFLPCADDIKQAMPADFDVDLLIALDSSDSERLGNLYANLAQLAGRVLVIDHHPTNVSYGTTNIILPGYTSTSEVVVDLLIEIGHPIGADVATCLLAGIVGDTVGFSVPAVGPSALRASALLIESGADLSDIYARLLTAKSFDEMKLVAVGTLKAHLEDGLLWTAVTNEDRRNHGLDGTKRAGLSNWLLNATEAKIAAVFLETEDNKVEVSLRARPGFDVAETAFALGGGGHILAAGCTLDGSLSLVVEKVMILLRDQLTAGGS